MLLLNGPDLNGCSCCAFSHTAFSRLDSPGQSLLLPKLVFVACQLAGIGIGLYKCWSMGLLPTESSDWLAWRQPRIVRTFLLTVALPQSPLTDTFPPDPLTVAASHYNSLSSTLLSAESSNTILQSSCAQVTAELIETTSRLQRTIFSNLKSQCVCRDPLLSEYVSISLHMRKNATSWPHGEITRWRF